MNAAETIQAAIDRLAALRESATQGPWLGWKQYNPLYGMQYGIESGRGEEVFASGALRDDVELVEMMHRTIDAQLAILRHAVQFNRGDLGIGINRHAVALAEAILGGAK